MGFVDIKVCAVTDVWSALKLVIRQKQRLAKTVRANSIDNISPMEF